MFGSDNSRSLRITRNFHVYIFKSELVSQFSTKPGTLRVVSRDRLAWWNKKGSEWFPWILLKMQLLDQSPLNCKIGTITVEFAQYFVVHSTATSARQSSLCKSRLFYTKPGYSSRKASKQTLRSCFSLLWFSKAGHILLQKYSNMCQNETTHVERPTVRWKLTPWFMFPPRSDDKQCTQGCLLYTSDAADE